MRDVEIMDPLISPSCTVGPLSQGWRERVPEGHVMRGFFVQQGGGQEGVDESSIEPLPRKNRFPPSLSMYTFSWAAAFFSKPPTSLHPPSQLNMKFISLLLVLVVVFGAVEAGRPLAHLISSKFSDYIGKLKHFSLQAAASTSSHGEAKGYQGGGGNGAITLDPVSIISLLALGAFLINNILQLLKANSGSGRSIDVFDMNIPLELSDQAGPFGRSVDRLRSMWEEEEGPSFSKFFENVGSLYYLPNKKRNICIKKVVCNYMAAMQAREENSSSIRNRIFDIMLSTITRFVAPEITSDPKSNICGKFNKMCSDEILHDAKVTTENKVYSQVGSLLSNLALSRFMTG